MKFSLDILLPFKLPIEDEIKFGSGYSFGDFLTTFHSYKKEIRIEDNELPIIQYNTCMSIDFLPSEGLFDDDVEDDEMFRAVVLNSIEYINKFIDALRTCFALDYLYNITIADLPEYLIISKDGVGCLYLTRPQELIREEILLNKEGMRILGNTLHTWDNYPEQFLVDKFFDSAKSHLYKEQLLDAIIDLQTSFEIYIRNTHRLVLLKNGSTQEEVERTSSFPFRNVIEQHLASQLSIDLNFNSQGPINDWYKNLYSIRNEIIHQGRIYITGEEAYSAYDSYVNVRNYIADSLVTNGYTNSNGNIDLNIFQKNTKESIDIEKVIRRLKQEGLIDEKAQLESKLNEE